jgi:hypothetical protein
LAVSDPSATLALEYFHIANGIVAFHLVQTIAFLGGLQHSAALRAGIERKRYLGHVIVWGIALGYLIAVGGSGYLEYLLRSHDPSTVLCATRIAATGRLVIVLLQAGVCSLVVQVIKEPPAKVLAKPRSSKPAPGPT